MSEEIGIYLGNKGYTIYKNCLELSEQKAIRKELTVKPYIPKSPVQPDPFAIYRESHHKFYIPRFYGLDNYGEPDENRLPKGKNISLEFKGDL